MHSMALMGGSSRVEMGMATVVSGCTATLHALSADGMSNAEQGFYMLWLWVA